jgi:hypothetical protein
LLNHYVKEYNIPLLFNNGFMDAMAVGEEIYQCDIVGGEPTIERLNPLKIRVFKSGYSNRIEDADIIILEDYWSQGKVIDTFYDVLTAKDIKYIEELRCSDIYLRLCKNVIEARKLTSYKAQRLVDEFELIDFSKIDSDRLTDEEYNSLVTAYREAIEKLKVFGYDPNEEAIKAIGLEFHQVIVEDQRK